MSLYLLQIFYFCFVQGCWLKNSSSTQSTCSCNHLTNFGILFDVWNEDKEDKLLDVISTILGTMSFLYLLATIVILWKKAAAHGRPEDMTIKVDLMTEYENWNRNQLSGVQLTSGPQKKRLEHN